MTTQTTAITLSTSAYVTNAGNNTVITTGPAVVNPTYTAGVSQRLNNFGELESTGTTHDTNSSGIYLIIGNNTTLGSTINNGGIITGYQYGIVSKAHTNATNLLQIDNAGSIIARATTNVGQSAGIFAGAATNNLINNTGLIEGAEGIWLQTDDSGVQTINNDQGGTIIGFANEGSIYGIKIQDNTNGLVGTGNIYNAGLIVGLVDDAAYTSHITNAATGTLKSGVFALGTGTLSLEAGGTFAGGANFLDGSLEGLNLTKATLVLGGAVSATGTLASAGAYTGFGNVTVQSGARWTIGTTASDTAGFAGVSTINNFGTLNIAGSLSGNTIDMEGSIAGTHTVVDFTGTNNSTPIVDFSANDQIIVSSLAVASGDNFKDTYNAATGVLTLVEYNAAGTSIGSAMVTVSGTAAGALSTASFVNVTGPGGDTIVLGSSSLANAGSIFIDNGESYLLNNTGTADTVPVTFGTHGTLGAFNTLDLNGSVSGTNSPYQGSITGFGLNDDIIIGPSIIPGDNIWNSNTGINDYVSLAYSGSLLTVTEYNGSGGVIGTTTLNVGTGYAAGSFVALYGTNGINIETPQTVDEQNLTLVGTGGVSASFVDPLAYAGGVSPGPTIISGETVTVMAGPTTAAVLQNPETNNGTIVVNDSQMVDMANPAGGSNLSGTGTIALENGGYFEQTAGTSSNTIAFGANTNGVISELSLFNSASSFTSPILGFGNNDEIFLGSNVLPVPVAGNELSDTYNAATGQLVITETNAGGTIVGSETLDVANTGSLSANSFVLVSGTNGVRVFLGSTQLSTNTGTVLGSTAGSIVIDHGQQVTFSNTTGVDNLPVTFGANGTSLALNVLDLTGTVAGTNSPYQGAISNFGLNDDIILGPSVLPSVASGDVVTLSYAGSLLTVTELNSSGASIGSTTLNVGTGYNANSFVALLGANGVNIETPQTVDEQTFNFGPLTNGTGYQGDFENPNDYAGGLAPGSNIVAGETVTVQQPAQANLNSSLTNNGVIVLNNFNANMQANAAIGGTGTIEVGNGSQLVLDNASGVTTNTIAFGGGSNNVLDLAGTGTASFAGTITGEAANDTIELGGSFLPTPSNASAITLNFNSTTGALTISDTVGGTVYTDTLHFAGPVPNNFAASLSNGMIVITDVPCFAAGTRILTPQGQVAVEHLAVGDEVLTLRDGAARKIIWTGQRTIDLARHAHPEKVRPVTIRAGAFADCLPERDLTVSPDHALFIDGHLIEAKTLVNGTTIIRDRAARFVTYHHIELDRHDVVLAEGLAAETYLDSGNRGNFEANAAPLILHPDFAAASRAGACAELLLDGDIVRAVRQQLLDRALALGFAQTGEIDLAVKAGIERLTAQPGGGENELMFVLPADARSVSLLSATGVPAEVSADPSDRRELGAAIAELALIAGGRRIVIDLDSDAHTGLHPAETGHRWTNGQACIALPAYTGRAVLEVTLTGQATRWRQTAA